MRSCCSPRTSTRGTANQATRKTRQAVAPNFLARSRWLRDSSDASCGASLAPAATPKGYAVHLQRRGRKPVPQGRRPPQRQGLPMRRSDDWNLDFPDCKNSDRAASCCLAGRHGEQAGSRRAPKKSTLQGSSQEPTSATTSLLKHARQDRMPSLRRSTFIFSDGDCEMPCHLLSVQARLCLNEHGRRRPDPRSQYSQGNGWRVRAACVTAPAKASMARPERQLQPGQSLHGD